MPRIPEGKFNKTPSVRVQGQRVPMPQNDGVTTALKTAQEVTNVMAKLQDQKERTDAYNAANDVKRGYAQQKSQYELNLENADASGNYSYADPMSEDPANPTIRKGNVNKDLDNLNQYYTSSQRNLMNLQRGDIASDLTQQYVGDDLNLLRVKTGKNLIRKSQKLQTENMMNNMSGNMVKILDLTSSDSSPELINTQVTATLNQIDREIATIGTSMGGQNLRKAEELKERLLSQTATNALNESLNPKSVKVAETLVSNIKDPLVRRNSIMKLENIKKDSTAKAERLTQVQAKELRKKIMTSDIVNAKDMIDAKSTLMSLKNAYVDPKYSTLDPAVRKAAINDLSAAIVSKHIIQENLSQTDDLANIEKSVAIELELLEIEKNRTPDSASEVVKDRNRVKKELEKVDAEIDDFVLRGIQSAGLRDVAGTEEEKMEIISLSRSNLKNLYTGLGKSIPAMRRTQYPNESSQEAYIAMDQSFDKLKIADKTYVPQESINAFRTDIKEAIKKQDPSSFTKFAQALDGAGEEYSRAVITDLTKGDKALEHYVVASDFLVAGNGSMAKKIDRDAKLVATTELITASDIGGNGVVTPRAAEIAFEAHASKIIQLEVQNNKAFSSLKTAMLNRAKAMLIDKDESSLSSAMKQTVEEFKEMYVVRRSDDGKNVISGINIKGGKQYTSEANLASLDIGVNNTLKNLNGVSIEEKRMLAKKLLKLDVDVDKLTEQDLGTYFNRHFYVEPDPRKMNNHRIMFDLAPVSLSDGKVLEYTMDDFLENGMEDLKIQQAPVNLPIKAGNKL